MELLSGVAGIVVAAMLLLRVFSPPFRFGVFPSQATPTIPPMVRAPYENYFPDFVIASQRILAEGYGGYVGAGFWDATWELSHSQSFVPFCTAPRKQTAPEQRGFLDSGRAAV